MLTLLAGVAICVVGFFMGWLVMETGLGGILIVGVLFWLFVRSPGAWMGAFLAARDIERRN